MPVITLGSRSFAGPFMAPERSAFTSSLVGQMSFRNTSCPSDPVPIGVPTMSSTTGPFSA